VVAGVPSVPRFSKRPKLPVRVTLSCGHTVRMRMRPLQEGARFGCSLNVGCGYDLEWVSWFDEDYGVGGDNTRHRK
jgi:hypothetical protein